MSTKPRPMSLRALLAESGLFAESVVGNVDVAVADIATRAQGVSRNEMFVAIRGTKVDSHQYLSDAVERGASVLVVDRDIQPYPGVAIVRVANTRRALGPLAHTLYGRPAAEMKIAAVTGTNGKTTTAWLVRHVLEGAGVKTGLVGTLGAFWGEAFLDGTHTTPDGLELARTFALMKADGVRAVAMEASSHGIDQGRIAGMPVHAGALTGITQDHLDYHGSYPEYISAKRRLFFEHVLTTPGGVACLNSADHAGEEMCHSYPGDILRWRPDDEDPKADLFARSIRSGADGTDFEMVVKGRAVPVRSHLIGRFSVINLMACAAMATVLGLSPEQIAAGIEKTPPVAGRFESIRSGQPFLVVIDYAHTPDALEKTLRAARRLTAGSLIAVFGCGGDRDSTKRVPMGKAAGRLADYIIVTSDNPRTEDPERIARQAVDGIRKTEFRASRHELILDRELAIEKALHLARPGDCVMICGKGHETYQEICGVRYQFDDRQVAREILSSMRLNWAGRNGGHVEEARLA